MTNEVEDTSEVTEEVLEGSAPGTPVNGQPGAAQFAAMV